MKLLMQYFRKGLVVVARNRKCRLNRMKVVIFQLMIKTPVAMPTKAVLSGTDSTQVFRRKEEGRGAIAAHEAPIQSADQYAPEYQQYLVLSELQQQ
jgi:hypothetical protein